MASQAEVTDVPEGKSHSTVQELMAVVPVFLTVHLPSKPVPQSWVLAYVAVAVLAAAAWAGPARPTRAASREQQGGEPCHGSVSGLAGSA